MVDSIPVLTFHAWGEPSSLVSFSPRVFVRGVKRLRECGFRALSLKDVVSRLGDGSGFPDRSFVLTIDDGYRSVYEHAFPVLLEYEMHATLFLTVGTSPPTATGSLPDLQGREMLRWDEVREMHRYGVDVEAHSLTHRDLTKMAPRDVDTEMRVSKEVIEDALGTSVSGFSYPYGLVNEVCREAARKHFRYACSDRLAQVTTTSNLFMLERIDAYYLRTDRRFSRLTERWFPWYLGLKRIPRQMRRELLARARSIQARY